MNQHSEEAKDLRTRLFLLPSMQREFNDYGRNLEVDAFLEAYLALRDAKKAGELILRDIARKNAQEKALALELANAREAVGCAEDCPCRTQRS